jgi:stage II sporulation protein D
MIRDFTTEYDVSGNPIVRIGMIQSAEEIRFNCDCDFAVQGLPGTNSRRGEKGKTYKTTIGKAQAAEVKYCARLGVGSTLADMERLASEKALEGIPCDIWRPGVILKFKNAIFDNSEYWTVTRPFANRREAERFISEYSPPGEAVIVRDWDREADGDICLLDGDWPQKVRIVPENETGVIRLHDVMVGIGFHWQHKRTQAIQGILEICFNKAGRLVAINEIDIEDYLKSVNSSEMSADNPVDLLKAQTVAARSTILATMGKHHYDEHYHVCSDDHCQCYHGTENISKYSIKAATTTHGQVLVHNDKICDARYAKICGGITEDFQNVWDHQEIGYLQSVCDGRQPLEPALDNEEEVRKFIDGFPDVYCNTRKYQIKSSLPYNSKELFRWRLSYSRDQLEQIIREKLDTDFGQLIDLVEGQRGKSGRLIYLDIVGSKRTCRIGKELQIRRVLSKSYLYSACFYIERERDGTGVIAQFHFHGAGWGHGVGLCQVGATVMAQLGFSYQDILQHYYRNTQLKKIY